MEEVLEMEAQGFSVKQIADHFHVCPKIIYAQKQAADEENPTHVVTQSFSAAMRRAFRESR